MLAPRSVQRQRFDAHTLRDAPAGPGDDFWYSPVSSGGPGGYVTGDTALQVSTVFACVRVLAETIGSLPLILYKKQSKGSKVRATEHPLYKILHDQPNSWQTSMDWRQMMGGHCALRGNGLAEIRPGPAGAVDQLLPLHPNRYKIEQRDDNEIIARVTARNGTTRVLLQDQLFRLNGISGDGITGLSVLGMARRTFGLSLSAEMHNEAFFNRGAKPAGVLTHPGQLSPEARARLRMHWDAMTGGIENAGRTAVLEEGMTWQAVGMTSQDAEFLATRKWLVTDICRWFRMPPHMVQDLERATFTNIEHQSIDFVVHTLRPWLVAWEQTITRDLIVDQDKYVAEHNVEGLLRGDAVSRTTVYNSGLTNGWLTPNEVRELENRNPKEGGDELRTPLNLGPMDGPPGDQKPAPVKVPVPRPAQPRQAPAPNRPARQVPAPRRRAGVQPGSTVDADPESELTGSNAKSDENSLALASETGSAEEIPPVGATNGHADDMDGLADGGTDANT
jgi:HK97 family phage portal protein